VGKASLANKHSYLRKAFAGALAWKTRGVDGVFLDCLILLGTVAECIKAKEKAKTPFIELFPYFFFQKKKP
jgi:hypothetical protein